MSLTHRLFFSETVTESFGQLVIQGILLIRFDWLVKKDDFDSFGVNFQAFVVISMTISFCTMLKAVLSYHNRTREALRPMFSMNNLFTVIMFAVILVSKTIVYMFGFQNSPGLFFVPVIVKIGISWILLTAFEPSFSALLAHERLTYLLVSFLVPISIPCKDKKKMAKNYGISLTLFYVECTSIIFFAVMIKKYYHFTEFSEFYNKFPELLNLGRFQFETIAFFLFLICLGLTLLATIFICLSTKSFHPAKSLFKPKDHNVSTP